MVTSMVPVQNTKNVWAAGEGSDQGITGGQQGDDSLQSEMMTGNSADISLSNVSVSGSKAGGKVKVSFTVTGNKNNKKKMFLILQYICNCILYELKKQT